MSQQLNQSLDIMLPFNHQIVKNHLQEKQLLEQLVGLLLEIKQQLEKVTINKSSVTYVPVNSAELSATNATADVSVYTTDGSEAGENISAIVGEKATSEPTSGYYLAFTGSGSGGSAAVSKAGYAPTTLSKSVSVTSKTKYFPITAADYNTGSGTATLTVAESTAAISGKTNISGSVAAPQTGTSISTPYYYAFTVASSGSGSGTVKTSGYAKIWRFNRNCYSF